MIKACLFIMGIVFVILGILGLLLPIIPQVPFFVLGMLFLCAASNKFKKKLVSSALYQRYLKSWVDSHDKLSEFMKS